MKLFDKKEEEITGIILPYWNVGEYSLPHKHQACYKFSVVLVTCHCIVQRNTSNSCNPSEDEK